MDLHPSDAIKKEKTNTQELQAKLPFGPTGHVLHVKTHPLRRNTDLGHVVHYSMRRQSTHL